MPLFALSFLVVILSNLVYHVSQKSVPREAHPIVSLLVTYGVAIGITLLLIPFFPIKEPIGREFRKLNWSSAVIGAAIVGVELGFLLAYRAGWRISVGSAAANAAVAALLVPTGLVLFGEKLSEANIAGLVLCLAGLLLVVMR
jgi:drug/metabolite transporter (DMT)-like permease